MSDRTIAIIASVMAAVSFAHDAIRVSLSVRPIADALAWSADAPERGADVQLSPEGLRVRMAAAGRTIDMLVVVTLPAA